MSEGCFEKLRVPFRLVAQSVCVVALVLFSLSPRTVHASDHTWPALGQSRPVQTQSFGSLWAGTVGAAFERWAQNGGEQRRMWVARIDGIELRLERDSSRASASWSVTILVHASGGEDGSGPEKCI
jgi:hypothetical protein